MKIPIHLLEYITHMIYTYSSFVVTKLDVLEFFCRTFNESVDQMYRVYPLFFFSCY